MWEILVVWLNLFLTSGGMRLSGSSLMSWWKIGSTGWHVGSAVVDDLSALLGDMGGAWAQGGLSSRGKGSSMTETGQTWQKWLLRWITKGAGVKLGMRTLPPTLCMMHGGGHGPEESICLIGWTSVLGSRAKVMSSGNLPMGPGSSRKSPGHTVVAEGGARNTQAWAWRTTCAPRKCWAQYPRIVPSEMSFAVINGTPASTSTSIFSTTKASWVK